MTQAFPIDMAIRHEPGSATGGTATMRECDVGVVGGGVIGLTCAFSLARAGYQVTVIAHNLPGDKTTEWASPW